jgi:hypothetical protein
MRTLLVAILALAAAPAAYAQPESAYYGLALGNLEFQENDFAGRPIIDDKVSSYRLMVGYQFLEHLGVEGGYGESKKINGSASLVFFPGAAPIDLDVNYEFRFLTLRLLGVLPFDNGMSLVGGVSFSDIKFKYNLTDGVDTESGSESTNEPGYYVGVQYDWDRVGVRLAYEKLDFEGGLFSDDVDSSETSVVFFYKL